MEEVVVIIVECTHPVLESNYVQAWCAMPRYRCKECGYQIKIGDELLKGTIFNPDGDNKILKVTGKFGELRDSDLEDNNQ